jgi:hypothetical protein
MSYLKATTPRDFLVGLTFKINISRQPAKGIRSSFTLAPNKEMADLKSMGCVPALSGNLENMAAMWAED